MSRRVSDGSFFRVAFTLALRAGTALSALGAPYGSYLLWRSVSRDMGFNGFLALLGWLSEGWLARRLVGSLWLSSDHDGVLAIVTGLGLGFASLACCYFVAEQASALTAVERNTRREP
jgi:hypothetical protein